MFQEKLTLKIIYYYIIAILAFFILMWGIIDFTSSGINLLALEDNNMGEVAPTNTSTDMSPPLKGSEPLIDDYYHKKMVYDRFGDSLARFLIAGLFFLYARWRISKIERKGQLHVSG